VHVTYQLADRSVGQFFLHLRSLAESRLAEMQQIARASTETGAPFDAVATEELVRRVRADAVTLIDVRPREEYLAGHIPGAISLPLDDLPKRVRGLSRTRDVVAYCRGPYCVLAVEAVRLLRRKGLRAHRLTLGAVEWRARGWRLDVGAADVH
jgi:rhodanese-related sulfurtransferase